MKYLHVSKSFLDGAGTTYRRPGPMTTDRAERRSGRITSHQQKKAAKAWRAERKCEAVLDAKIARYECDMDWLEEERDNDAFEWEQRQCDLYDEHFS